MNRPTERIRTLEVANFDFRYAKITEAKFLDVIWTLSNSSMKLVCNVNIVNGNLKSERTLKIMPGNKED
jgi:hypothetical protein